MRGKEDGREKAQETQKEPLMNSKPHAVTGHRPAFRSHARQKQAWQNHKRQNHQGQNHFARHYFAKKAFAWFPLLRPLRLFAATLPCLFFVYFVDFVVK
jgi:hypothetical protein